MTDTDTIPTLAVIEERLAAVHAETAAADAQAAANAAAEAERCDALDTAKAICAAACGPIGDALTATTDDAERAALVELEAETHAGHADALEAAYVAFSTQGADESNPATPGVTTPISADVVVNSEVSPAPTV